MTSFRSRYSPPRPHRHWLNVCNALNQRPYPHTAIAATINFKKPTLQESTLGPMFHEYIASTLHSPVREPIFQVAKRSFHLSTSVFSRARTWHGSPPVAGVRRCAVHSLFLVRSISWRVVVLLKRLPTDLQNAFYGRNRGERNSTDEIERGGKISRRRKLRIKAGREGHRFYELDEDITVAARGSASRTRMSKNKYRKYIILTTILQCRSVYRCGPILFSASTP